MKLFQKILILSLVFVLAIGIAACGPKENSNTVKAPTTQSSPVGSEAEEIVTAAPGKLTFLADVELTLGYDNNGNALALTGDSEAADRLAAQCNIAGKSCADAMAVILPVLAYEHIQMRGFITIRQELGSVTPGEHFMSKIAAAAQKADAAPVVVISIADMDSTGYFNQEIAEQVIRAAKGEDAEILHITAMYEGRYVATVKEDGAEVDYAISALTSTVSLYSQTTNEPYDETMGDSMDDSSDNPNEELEQEESSAEEEKEEEPAA